MQKPNLHSFKPLRLLALAGLCAMSSQLASGAVILSISDPVGDPNSVVVDPNNPASRCFSITVALTASEATTGLTFLLSGPLNPNQNPSDPNDNGLFYIAGRNTTGTAYSALSHTDGELGFGVGGNPADAVLDPTNTFDLGGVVANIANPVPPGSDRFIETLVVCILPNAPAGDYNIQTALQSATGAGPDFDELPIGTASYTVHVVPEPGVACLFALGTGFIGWARRRRIA